MIKSVGSPSNTGIILHTILLTMKAKWKTPRKANPQQPKKKVTRRKRAMSRMTPEYAQLLADPCTGPLVRSSASTAGASVVRFESDFIIGNGATDTAGFLLWTPNNRNADAGNVYGFGTLVGLAASDTASITPSAGGSGTYFPGNTFLATNAGSYRTLAACIQVYWPGSELNRAGIVSVAQCTNGLLKTTDSVNVAALRSQCPVVRRMPTNFLEAKFGPGFADGMFHDPTTGKQEESGLGAILVTWAGLPVATGVRLRLVAVYEWTPKVSGLVLSSNTAGASPQSFVDARKKLDEAAPDWWYTAGSITRRIAVNADAFMQGVAGAAASTVAYSARRAGGGYIELG